MTPAELKTTREALRLDGRHLAELLRVSYDTERRWESRGHIPPGVGPELDAVLAEVAGRIDRTVETVRQAVARAGGPPEAVHLVRYRSPDQAEAHLGDRRQALLHTAAVTGVYEALRAQGIPARLVLLDDDAYDAWLDDSGGADCEAARAEWAGLQLT